MLLTRARRGFLGLLAAIWMAWAGFAPAAGLDNLYEASIAVADQSEAERARAFADALTEVVVKVSGTRDTLGRAAVATLLKDPARVVQQYRYELAPPTPEAAGTALYLLWVRFESTAVDQALTEAGSAVWKQDRPETLVWLTVAEGGARFFAGAGEGQNFVGELEQAARRRGVPVLFPLLDLEDQTGLQVSDVWGGFQDNILRASQRYRATSVLTGRLSTGGVDWDARWTLFLNGQASEWSSRGQLAEVMAAGMNGLADALAARYAVRAESAGATNLMLFVSGIESVDQYVRVERYLAQLTPVTRVEPVELGPSNVRYLVRLRGERSDLQQAIGLGGDLIPDVDLAAPQNGAADEFPALYYRIRP